MKKGARMCLRIIPFCFLLFSLPAYSVQKAKVTAEMATVLKNKDDANSGIAEVKKGDVLITGNKNFGDWIRVVAPGAGAPASRIGWMRLSDLEMLPATAAPTEAKPEKRKPEKKSASSVSEPWKKTYLAGFFDLAILSPSSLQTASGYTTGFAIASNFGFEIGRQVSPKVSAGLKFDILSLSATGFKTGGKILTLIGDYTLSETEAGKRDFSVGAGLGYLFGGSISGEVGTTNTLVQGPGFSAMSLLIRVQKYFELSEQLSFKLNFGYRYITSKTIQINSRDVITQQSGPLLGFGLEYVF